MNIFFVFIVLISYICEYISGGSVWTDLVSTTSQDYLVSVTEDPNTRDVYATGATYGILNGNPNAGDLDFFLVKYNSEGVRQFAKSYGGTLRDHAREVIVYNGDVFLGGESGGMYGETSTGGIDFALMRLSSAGVMNFVRLAGTNVDDYNNRMAVDAQGNFYLIGLAAVGSNYNYDVFAACIDSSGIVKWSKTYSSDGNAQDEGLGIAVDNVGNAYILGSSYASWSSGTIPNQGDSDVLFIKIMASTGAVIMIKLFGGSRYEAARQAIYDPASDSIYAVGALNGNFNGQIALGNGNIAVYKISSAGVLQWTTARGTLESSDVAYYSQVDSQSRVWVIGITSGSLNGNLNMGSYDMAVMVLDLTGQVVGTKLYGTAGNDQAIAGFLSSTGSLILGGTVTTAFDGKQFLGGTSQDGIVKKVNSADVLYNANEWTRMEGSFYEDQLFSVTEDSSGNVYATGRVSGSIDGVSAFGGMDAVLIKYDKNGVKQYTKIFGTPGENELGRTVHIHPSDGNIYVGGDGSGGMNGASGYGYIDFMVMKLTNAGVLLSTRLSGTSSSDYCAGMVIDSDGFLYLAGTTASSTNNIFVAKINMDLEIIWTKTFDSSNGAHDYGNGIAVDLSGNIFVSGGTYGTWNGVASQGQDILILKIGSSTGLLLSSKLYDSSAAEDYGMGITYDPSCNCLYQSAAVAGTFKNSKNYGGFDSLLLKLDLNAQIIWSSQIGSTQNDRTTNVCLDSVNNVTWVVGYSYGNLNSQTNSNKGATAYDDTYAMAYDGAGNVLDTKLYGLSRTYDACFACFPSSSGALYIAGHSSGQMDGRYYIGDGSINKWDGYVKKIDVPNSFSLNKASKWTRHVSATGYEAVTDLVTDNIGNVYALGSTTASLYGVSGFGGIDVFMIKYSVSGQRLVTKIIGTTQDDNPLNLVYIASNNNVYIGFYTQETTGQRLKMNRVSMATGNVFANIIGTDLGTINEYVLDTALSSYFVGKLNGVISLWKYDSSATQIYRKDYTNSGSATPSSMVLDNAGNVYVTGTASSWSGVTGVGGNDMLLMKIDTSSGNLVWTKMFGSSGSDNAYSLTYHALSKMVYLCGNVFGSINGQNYYGSNDFAILKIDASSGSLIWARQHGGSSDELCYQVTIDDYTGLVVSTGGVSSSSLYSEYNIGDVTTTTVVLSQDGDMTGIEMHGAVEKDQSAAVVVDGTGSLLVGGSTLGSMDGQYIVGVSSNGFIRKIPLSSILTLFNPPQPTSQPSSQPSSKPSMVPTGHPSSQPTAQPSMKPTGHPSSQPTAQPFGYPSSNPSTQPSRQPTNCPTALPSTLPSGQPSMMPSSQPSGQPTKQPFALPTSRPSGQPSRQPSIQPTSSPSNKPSSQPSSRPSSQPTLLPSGQPSRQPTAQPSRRPTSQPSSQPSTKPSRQPSTQPSVQPTAVPSRVPTTQPSSQPTRKPSSQPSRQPSSRPTGQPSFQPSRQPSSQPSSQPSLQPNSRPSSQPSRQPTSQPSRQPTKVPTVQPSVQPSGRPSCQPSSQPSRVPSCQPTSIPTSQPSSIPSHRPSNQPSSIPTSQPSCQPTTFPTSQPSSYPSAQPTSFPTGQPSAHPTVYYDGLGSLIYSETWGVRNNIAFALLGSNSSSSSSLLYVWGDPKAGGNMSFVLQNINSFSATKGSITKIAASSTSYVVLFGDGSIVAWGSPQTISGWQRYQYPTAAENELVDVVGNIQAFAGITKSGAVVCFGVSNKGGSLPEEYAVYLASDVIGIAAASSGAFAAWKADGSVYTWGGKYAGGGVCSLNRPDLYGVVKILGSEGAFVGIREDNSFLTWGNCYYGGCFTQSAPPVRLGYVTSAPMVFIGYTVDRRLIAWGFADQGGSIPASLHSYMLQHVTRIDFIESNRMAVAVLANGNTSVLCWGNTQCGGDCQNISLLSAEIIVSIASTEKSFAVVTSRGRVLAWGHSDYGGTIPATISADLSSDIVEIVASTAAFAVRKQTGKVLSWGNSVYGGSTSRVAALLNSNVVKLAANQASFLALRQDGSVVGWGNPQSIVNAGLQSPSVMMTNSLEFI